MNGTTCRKCGRELGYEDEKKICTDCQGRDHHYDRAMACIIYEGKGKELIHRYKFQGEQELAVYFARLMVGRIVEQGDPVNEITYVPLHEEREKQRGYNQSQLLAEAIGQELKIPVQNRLHRKRQTRHQYDLHHGERIANVRDAFEAEENLGFLGHILLIDDIYTTGSTVDQCAKALKEKGVKEVTVLTIANGRMKE